MITYHCEHCYANKSSAYAARVQREKRGAERKAHRARSGAGSEAGSPGAKKRRWVLKIPSWCSRFLPLPAAAGRRFSLAAERRAWCRESGEHSCFIKLLPTRGAEVARAGRCTAEGGLKISTAVSEKGCGKRKPSENRWKSEA